MSVVNSASHRLTSQSDCGRQIVFQSNLRRRLIVGFPRHYSWDRTGSRSKRVRDEQYRITHELSYLLRHGAHHERVPIRPDGYINVETLLNHPPIHARGLHWSLLRRIVRDDKKIRYHLQREVVGGVESWWIRANQGHSMSDIELDLKRILSSNEIPMAVHGTTMEAWRQISKVGLSRMARNHIHLAQGFVGDVISGMRSSSQILVFIDVKRALDAGVQFYLSSNGVVLTPGNDKGLLEPQFFSDVKHANSKNDSVPIPDWSQ
ncbi:KptA family-domain-containing protein [Mycena amicta]|nr:KptA family-domain-containing protein [Mycena amicta]